MADEKQSNNCAVILGVGNRLRGDDAIGCLVIDELQDRAPAVLFDGGPAPESFLEPIIRLAPKRILIVDACAFGGRPGEFRLFGQEDITRLPIGNLSTHTMPLTLLVELLQHATGSEIWLLGVEPLEVGFGQPISEPVAEALPQLVELCRNWAQGSI